MPNRLPEPEQETEQEPKKRFDISHWNDDDKKRFRLYVNRADSLDADADVIKATKNRMAFIFNNKILEKREEERIELDKLYPENRQRAQLGGGRISDEEIPLGKRVNIAVSTPYNASPEAKERILLSKFPNGTESKTIFGLDGTPEVFVRFPHLNSEWQSINSPVFNGKDIVAFVANTILNLEILGAVGGAIATRNPGGGAAAGAAIREGIRLGASGSMKALFKAPAEAAKAAAKVAGRSSVVAAGATAGNFLDNVIADQNQDKNQLMANAMQVYTLNFLFDIGAFAAATGFNLATGRSTLFKSQRRTDKDKAMEIIERSPYAKELRLLPGQAGGRASLQNLFLTRIGQFSTAVQDAIQGQQIGFEKSIKEIISLMPEDKIGQTIIAQGIPPSRLREIAIYAEQKIRRTLEKKLDLPSGKISILQGGEAGKKVTNAYLTIIQTDKNNQITKLSESFSRLSKPKMSYDNIYETLDSFETMILTMDEPYDALLNESSQGVINITDIIQQPGRTVSKVKALFSYNNGKQVANTDLDSAHFLTFIKLYQALKYETGLLNNLETPLQTGGWQSAALALAVRKDLINSILDKEEKKKVVKLFDGLDKLDDMVKKHTFNELDSLTTKESLIKAITSGNYGTETMAIFVKSFSTKLRNKGQQQIFRKGLIQSLFESPELMRNFILSTDKKIINSLFGKKSNEALSEALLAFENLKPLVNTMGVTGDNIAKKLADIFYKTDASTFSHIIVSGNKGMKSAMRIAVLEQLLKNSTKATKGHIRPLIDFNDFSKNMDDMLKSPNSKKIFTTGQLTLLEDYTFLSGFFNEFSKLISGAAAIAAGSAIGNVAQNFMHHPIIAMIGLSKISMQKLAGILIANKRLTLGLEKAMKEPVGAQTIRYLAILAAEIARNTKNENANYDDLDENYNPQLIELRKLMLNAAP